MLILALAVSLDGLAVGFTYGMRGIKVTLQAHGVIAGVSGLLMLAAMAVGTVVAMLAPVAVITALGAALLILIGMWHILSARLRGSRVAEVTAPRRLMRLRLSSLGVVIEILHDPLQADIDRSGTIDIGEALALGVALGLDALAAGVAAAMLGISYWIVPFATVSCVALIASGHKIGRAAGQTHSNWVRWPWSAGPGLLLVIMGLVRLGG